MSLVFFKFLLQCWSSEGVSPSKFEHGLFKKDCLELQESSISLDLNPHWIAGFYSHKLWGLLLWH